MRLIPAWAGKTTFGARIAATAAAHPRVGGENEIRVHVFGAGDGSSPRGRGKQWSCKPHSFATRLIPAWAGKTYHLPDTSSRTAAHPRVGGENAHAVLAAPMIVGSSPRGRGKRARSTPGNRLNRLIPAWAGKTLTAHLTRRIIRAHPRVGGENRRAPFGESRRSGSSPRGRGKPPARLRGAENLRLIPAWAGKTGSPN